MPKLFFLVLCDLGHSLIVLKGNSHNLHILRIIVPKEILVSYFLLDIGKKPIKSFVINETRLTASNVTILFLGIPSDIGDILGKYSLA